MPTVLRTSGPHPDAPEHVAEVDLHRALADPEAPADLLVRETPGHQPQHLELPRAQRRAAGARRPPVGQQRPRDPRVERRLAAPPPADAARTSRRLAVLEEVADGAGGERLAHPVAVRERGEHHDRASDLLGEQPPGGLDAVQHRASTGPSGRRRAAAPRPARPPARRPRLADDADAAGRRSSAARPARTRAWSSTSSTPDRPGRACHRCMVGTSSRQPLPRRAPERTRSVGTAADADVGQQPHPEVSLGRLGQDRGGVEARPVVRSTSSTSGRALRPAGDRDAAGLGVPRRRCGGTPGRPGTPARSAAGGSSTASAPVERHLDVRASAAARRGRASASARPADAQRGRVDVDQQRPQPADARAHACRRRCRSSAASRGVVAGARPGRRRRRREGARRELLDRAVVQRGRRSAAAPRPRRPPPGASQRLALGLRAAHARDQRPGQRGLRDQRGAAGC